MHDWLRVAYDIAKPANKLLTPIELDSDTWVSEVKRLRGKKHPSAWIVLFAQRKITSMQRGFRIGYVTYTWRAVVASALCVFGPVALLVLGLSLHRVGMYRGINTAPPNGLANQALGTTNEPAPNQRTIQLGMPELVDPLAWPSDKQKAKRIEETNSVGILRDP